VTYGFEDSELAEAFGWVACLVDGHRAHNGRDAPLALALLSAGASLLIPQLGPSRTGEVAAEIVRKNALSIAQSRVVQ